MDYINGAKAATATLIFLAGCWGMAELSLYLERKLGILSPVTIIFVLVIAIFFLFAASP